MYRRIGTTSFLYRDSRTGNGSTLEQEAVLRCIADAGALKIDILLFQEEYTFWQSDVEDAPGRRRFAPAQTPRA